MCIANPTLPAAHPSSPPTPDAESLLPPPSPIDDFNAQLALAKIAALEALLRICQNADGAASPEEVRRAASAILRCPPLRDPDPAHTPAPPTAAREGMGGRDSSSPAPAPRAPAPRPTRPPRPLSRTEQRALDTFYAAHPEHRPRPVDAPPPSSNTDPAAANPTPHAPELISSDSTTAHAINAESRHHEALDNPAHAATVPESGTTDHHSRGPPHPG